jgi:hypothetical protein
LELSKCFYYLLSWKWDDKGNPVAETQQDQIIGSSNLQISLNKESKNPTFLEQKEVNISHKTLGTFKLIVGKETDHIEYLQTKSDELSKLTMSSQFNRRQSRRAFNSCYLPAMSYSLTAVNLLEDQINNIQKNAITTYIRKSGYDMHFPRKIVYSPVCYGGLGFKKLSVESNCRKIESMVSHVNANTSLGKSFKIILNWVQVHSGLSTPILENRTDIDYIQHNWYSPIREFLKVINGKISVRNTWTPIKKRKHDFVLMDKVAMLQIPNWTKRLFNNWRLFFQVESLSDITTLDGENIDGRYSNKKFVKEYTSTSKTRWPNQQHPNVKFYSTWWKIIKTIVDCDSKGRLRVPLGLWEVVPTLYNEYNVLMHQSTDFMITKDSKNIWKKSTRSHTVRSKIFFTKNGNDTMSDINWTEFIPVPYMGDPKFYIINGRKIGSIQRVQQSVVTHSYDSSGIKLESFIHNNNNLFQQLIKYTTIYKEEILVENIYQEITLCSDGGAKKGKGSFGIACMLQDMVLLECNNRTPNTYEEANCHRCEAMGILVTLKIVDLIHKFAFRSETTIYPHHWRVICDNESVIKTIKKIRNKKLTLKQHYMANIDVLRAIEIYLNYLKKRWRCNIYLSHVKGHQDKHNKTKSSDELINIQADKMATEGLKKNNVSNILLPGDRIQILINGNQVGSNHTRILRNCYHSAQMYTYFQEKYKWKDTIINKIWWEVHGKAMLPLQDCKRTIIQKFIHNRLPCNKRESLYYEYRSTMCYTCKSEQESENHILQCQQCKKRNILRNSYTRTLQTIMTAQGTNSTTIRVILSYVRAWLNRTEVPIMEDIAPEASTDLLRAVEEQNTIGWDQWFRGRISRTWGELYNHDIAKPNILIRRPSALRWGREIISATFNFTIESWYARNEMEHDKLGDPTLRIKDKMSDQIKWELKQLSESENEDVWTKITKEQLLEMPKENLEMMLIQIQMKKNRKKE